MKKNGGDLFNPSMVSLKNIENIKGLLRNIKSLVMFLINFYELHHV